MGKEWRKKIPKERRRKEKTKNKSNRWKIQVHKYSNSRPVTIKALNKLAPTSSTTPHISG